MVRAIGLIEQEGAFLHPASVSVVIGEFTLYIVPDLASADRIARLLNSARESKYHTAMNILTEQLFMATETAQAVLDMLHNEFSPIGIQNGKLN